MIVFEEDFRSESIYDVAKKIATAARTAPKARGTDNMTIAVATSDTLEAIAQAMHKYSEKHDVPFFARDAENLRQSAAAVLIGSKVSCLGLNCGYCGFATCAEKAKYAKVPCFFNANDMGIAVGSAVSLAADMRVDSRVMFSVGKMAMDMNLMPSCSMVLAIPLSVSGKSPFFDRK
jgi:uncharacterized ferredoxin-like protein